MSDNNTMPEQEKKDFTSTQEEKAAVEENQAVMKKDQKSKRFLACVIDRVMMPFNMTLKLGTYLTGLAVFVSLATYISEADNRHQAQVTSAWSTILANSKQPGDAGRRNAIEFLISRPRRFPYFWQRWTPQRLDGLQAPQAILPCLDVSRQSLYKVNFSEADLSGSNFSHSNLSQSNLSSANFTYSNATIRGNATDGSDRDNCGVGWISDFSRASLYEANLKNADLRMVNLSGADLSGADLSGANLNQADLTDARLMRANLSDANLNYVDLRNVIFSRASPGLPLDSIEYGHARDTATNLSGALLLAANLQNPTLMAIQLDSKTNQDADKQISRPPYLCGVLLPDHITDVDPDRDCDELEKILVERYNLTFSSAYKAVREGRVFFNNN